MINPQSGGAGFSLRGKDCILSVVSQTVHPCFEVARP